MNRTDFQNEAAFLQLIAIVSKSLSTDSIKKAFSADAISKASQCKNTMQFIRFLRDLELPELKGKLNSYAEKIPSHSLLDNILSKRQLPSNEEFNQCIRNLESGSKGLISDVCDGAAAGACAGAVIGTTGGAMAGGIGAGPGLIGGTIAGGIGGAIGGVINWATSGEKVGVLETL